jgi:hypothetical protein
MQTKSYLGIALVVVMCVLGFVTSCLCPGSRRHRREPVTDASGAVLPGVTLTLSNPLGTLGGNQTTVTDERGALSIRQAGARHLYGARRAFRVPPCDAGGDRRQLRCTARADMRLQIGALEEGIIVSGQSPLLDTTSAMRQTVISREVLNALPNRVDVWSVARVIPSVILSKVDVGGSESFLQSSATVHGSSNENGF